MSTGNRPARLTVLLSGSGRTLANMIDHTWRGLLDAEIVSVISSKAGVRGLDIAVEAGIPSTVITRQPFADDQTFSDAVFASVAQFEPDLLICAGYLKKLVVTERWDGRILNIHPSLIPESNAAGAGFYGLKVHQAVLDSGACVSGATVHVVDNEYDQGPIVLKEMVPVLPGDTAEVLAARVFELECSLYPRAIAQYLADNPGLLASRVAYEQ